jgi:hypothetical protein
VARISGSQPVPPRLVYRLVYRVRGFPALVQEDPAACRVGSEGLKQRGRQPIRRGVRGGSPALQLRALLIRSLVPGVR